MDDTLVPTQVSNRNIPQPWISGILLMRGVFLEEPVSTCCFSARKPHRFRSALERTSVDVLHGRF